MNIADWVIIAVIGTSTLISIRRGFVKEALSLATWAVAFVVARLFGTQLATALEGYIDQPSVRIMAAFALLFVATLIVGAMINHLIGELIKLTGLSGTDRLFGMVFGLARGALIIVVFTAVAGLTPLTEDTWWKESKLIPHFQLVEEWSRETFLGMGDSLGEKLGE